VPEIWAMNLMGHKPPSVFRRYAINEVDLRGLSQSSPRRLAHFGHNCGTRVVILRQLQTSTVLA
jgi:hypothetical protein